MSYQVLARKWRPQQFDDLVGQQHIARTLKNAIERNRVAHAYLFVGPRGIGKTSSARIFAKALNCFEGPTPTPCDKCDSCLEIMHGNALDVIEIDGASNNGVDQVRDLRDNTRYSPSRGPYKIYIIDEVHMLSKQAFNALLKTLEEPPAHVKFIFATTEPQKVLATITSRCQRFDLRRISIQDISDHLRKIADAEKMRITDEAILAIARGAEGGLRDAESTLDQLSSFCTDEITEGDVLSVFGLISSSDLESLSTAVLQGDIDRLILLTDKLDKAGRDMKSIVFDLIDHFKNLLIFMHTKAAAEVLDVSDIQLDVFRSQQELIGPERVLEIVDHLIELEGRLRYALSPRTLLETALIKCARAATVVGIDEILAKLERLGTTPARDGGGSTNYSTPPASDEMPKKKVEERPAHQRLTPARFQKELQALNSAWAKFCDECGRAIPGAHAYLQDTRPLSVDCDWVVIGIDSEFYENDLDNVKMARFKDGIQNALCNRLGRDVGVKFEPTEFKPNSGKICAETESQAAKNGKSPREWCNDPIVLKTLEVFDGKISDLRL